jgi:hypothetical protein
VALPIVLGSLAAAGCGDDEPGATDASPRVEGTSAADAAPGPGGATDGESPGGNGETTEPQGGEGSEACTFEAPPGRLGVADVPVELSGVTCEQGRRLVQTAAVGQPAGANLSLSRDGFDCRPSTREKGATVTYTCARGPQRASFEIVWSAAP